MLKSGFTACPKPLVLFVLGGGSGQARGMGYSKLHVSAQILNILLDPCQRFACFNINLIYGERAQIKFKSSKGACACVGSSTWGPDITKTFS